jgi:hypothetical protein
MNLKHPYEKHLAEKLVQLPPPGDPDQNWQQMKAMLDEDMPRGGGGILGGYRWMIPTIIILAIGSGIWFGGRQFLPMNRGDKSMAGTINKTHNNKPVDANKADEKTAGQTVLPEGNATVETTIPDNNVATSETSQKELVAGNVPATSTNDVTNPVLPNDQKEFSRSRSLPENDQGTVAVNTAKTASNITSNNNEINNDRKKVYSKKKNNKRKPNNRVTNNNAAETASITKITETQPVVEEPVVAAAEEEDEDKRFVSLPSVRLHKPSVRTAPKSAADIVKESPVDIIVDYTGTTLIMPSGVLQRNYTHLSPVELFPDLAVQNKSSRRRSGRSYEARNGRALAIGLSLPLGFPLGDQEPLAYNRHAGANTISDYIPSPHLQYHLNNRTYFQTQVQLSQPQFIRPILLFQEKAPTPQTNTFIYHSIYARKLYYFNLPVSVYHSPLRNFYMGTGLQFSSMLSGVALTEQRKVSPGDEYIINQTYSKFGNDSLSRRFNNSEVRLLLDMNYYWNRFIVGLQYNQAFNNYVSFQVNPASPYIFDKNKSLQFYLRYNIWEDRKRKRKSETMLSLK